MTLSTEDVNQDLLANGCPVSHDITEKAFANACHPGESLEEH
jgi:hypothetical protein